MITPPADNCVNKLLGMWIAHALGDALGSPYEFNTSLPWNYRLTYPIVRRRRYAESINGAIGQISDDASMTLALLESIVKDKKYNTDTVILGYIEWAKQCPFMGRNTRALFKTIKTVAGYRAHFKNEFTDKPQIEWSRSNGCLMRATPLFLLPMETIEMDCKLTNPHPETIEIVKTYCTMLKLLYVNTNPIDVFHIIGTQLTQQSLRDVHTHFIACMASLSSSKVEKSKIMAIKYLSDPAENRGLAIHAWTFCLHSLLLIPTCSLQDLMELTIRVHRAGDTDTNAAIVAALYGIYHGMINLDKGPDTQYNIQTMLDATYTGIPSTYHPKKYFDLATQYLKIVSEKP